MKLSAYTIIVPSVKNPNDVCFYHTLFDHLIRISLNDGHKLDQLLQKIKAGNLSGLSSDEEQLVKVLMQMGFLIQDNVDEKKLFEHWFRTVLQESHRSFVATILTTMSCNLCCPYCYQRNSLSSSKFMSLEMAQKVSTWLQQRIIEKNVQKMNIVFFGGEPLLNCKVIEEISKNLQATCRSLGIDWKAGVITNGTLLTKEVAEMLQRAGITWVKVTIDGDRDAHNKLRPYASGKGSFDQIFENLSVASHFLRIMIGGNVDESNIESVPPLLDRLMVAPWRDAIISVRFKPIQWSGKNACGLPKTACQLSSFTEEQVQWMVRLREEVQARGLPVISDPNIGPCDFYRPNVISIGVDGSLYPCGAFVGINDCAMGNVQSDKLTDFGKKIEKLKTWDEKCYHCAFLPICAGGCRAAAYFDKGDIGATVCDKEFYDQMLPRYIDECDENNRRGKEQESMFE